MRFFLEADEEGEEKKSEKNHHLHLIVDAIARIEVARAPVHFFEVSRFDGDNLWWELGALLNRKNHFHLGQVTFLVDLVRSQHNRIQIRAFLRLANAPQFDQLVGCVRAAFRLLFAPWPLTFVMIAA